jgi:hypothetical protein
VNRRRFYLWLNGIFCFEARNRNPELKYPSGTLRERAKSLSQLKLTGNNVRFYVFIYGGIFIFVRYGRK